jgi:hypothetical protein
MNRQFWPVQTPGPNRLHLAAAFNGNGGSDPLSSTFTERWIKAVTRTANGTYEVELVDTVSGVTYASAHALDPTPDTNGIAQIVSHTLTTNGKFIVKYRVDGLDTNADAPVQINFLIIAKNGRE